MTTLQHCQPSQVPVGGMPSADVRFKVDGDKNDGAVDFTWTDAGAGGGVSVPTKQNKVETVVPPVTLIAGA